MDNLDILIFAVVAVLVLVRLWSVLGKRHDDEPQRPNPFSASVRPSQEEDIMVLPDRQRTLESLAITAAGHAPASLAGVLDHIKELDPSFDEKLFLQGAKEAFARIVEGFAQGDLSRIARWLAQPVLDSFHRVIVERKAKRQTLESRLDRIDEADISAAHLDGTQAKLTVTFVSTQTNVTRDARGNIMAGSPDHPEEIRDIWIFSRDLKAIDPNWILLETRS